MKKENSIYHVNSTVSNLNHVPGFDPMHYVRATENGMILDTPYQKLWFRLKFPNGKVKSMLVKLTDQLAIMEARVYFDRRDTEPAASHIAQCKKGEAPDYLKAAQNSAISQALSDAGFGIQFIPDHPETQKTLSTHKKIMPIGKQPVSSKAHEDKPADATATNVPAQAVLAEQHPPAEATVPVRETAPAETITIDADEFEEIIEEPGYTADMPVETICSMMTIEEAKSYVVKEGTCSGWTMATVAERRPASLKYYINGYKGSDNILRAAAILLMQTAS